MAHWAQVENNTVVAITVGNNDEPDEGYQWLVDNLGGTWIKTSRNTFGGVHIDPETGEPSVDQTKALRKNYAQIGWTYDEQRDAFVPPKPDAEPENDILDWVLNEETCLWEEVR